METFSVRDLRERSGELVRELEEGHLAVITKHGRPLAVTVLMTETLLEKGVPLALALELFKTHVVSLELAAKIAGVSYAAFLAQCDRRDERRPSRRDSNSGARRRRKRRDRDGRAAACADARR